MEKLLVANIYFNAGETFGSTEVNIPHGYEPEGIYSTNGNSLIEIKNASGSIILPKMHSVFIGHFANQNFKDRFFPFPTEKRDTSKIIIEETKFSVSTSATKRQYLIQLRKKTLTDNLPHLKKIDYKIATINVPANATEVRDIVYFDNGYEPIGVSNVSHPDIIGELQIKEMSGSTLIDPISFEFFKKTLDFYGKIWDMFLPIPEFNGNGLVLEVKNILPLPAQRKLFLLFLTEKNVFEKIIDEMTDFPGDKCKR